MTALSVTAARMRSSGRGVARQDADDAAVGGRQQHREVGTGGGDAHKTDGGQFRVQGVLVLLGSGGRVSFGWPTPAGGGQEVRQVGLEDGRRDGADVRRRGSGGGAGTGHRPNEAQDDAHHGEKHHPGEG